MLGQNLDHVGWPACGEIDVMENFGKDPAVVHGTVRGPGYSGASGVTASYDTGLSLADEFQPQGSMLPPRTNGCPAPNHRLPHPLPVGCRRTSMCPTVELRST
jgi:hypothetical protein